MNKKNSKNAKKWNSCETNSKQTETIEARRKVDDDAEANLQRRVVGCAADIGRLLRFLQMKAYYFPVNCLCNCSRRNPADYQVGLSYGIICKSAVLEVLLWMFHCYYTVGHTHTVRKVYTKLNYLETEEENVWPTFPNQLKLETKFVENCCKSGWSQTF